MKPENIKKNFAKIEARVDILIRPKTPSYSNYFSIDIRRDKDGEFFDIDTGIGMEILDVDVKDRHLLLMAMPHSGQRPKYLCGFDEQGPFVAAIPENGNGRRTIAGVSTVEQAKTALKPPAVVEAEERIGLKSKHRHKRNNRAWNRQGEWFFIPRPDLKVEKKFILHNEPINMGNKRSHMCQELYRVGGQTVYVNSANPNGLTETQFYALPWDKRSGFTSRTRDARVFVRGKIAAPDHKTKVFKIWHEVIPNTENQAAHARNVAFLD